MEEEENPNWNRGMHENRGMESRKPKPVSLLKEFSNLSMKDNTQVEVKGGGSLMKKIDLEKEREITTELLREKVSEEKKATGLIELEDTDILTITYNGITIEEKAGDISDGAKIIKGEGSMDMMQQRNEKMMIFTSQASTAKKYIKKQRIKNLARKGNSNSKSSSVVKRRTVEEQDEGDQKKICMVIERMFAKEVVGANPQLAP